MALSAKSRARIAHYELKGWTIVKGNNAYLPKAKKWSNHECLLIVRSNGVGGSTIIWAVKDKNTHEIDCLVDEINDLKQELIYWKNIQAMMGSGIYFIGQEAGANEERAIARIRDNILEAERTIEILEDELQIKRVEPYQSINEGSQSRSSGSKRL